MKSLSQEHSPPPEIFSLQVHIDLCCMPQLVTSRSGVCTSTRFQLSLSSVPFRVRALPAKAATLQTLNHIQVEVEDGHAMSTVDPAFVTRALVQGTGQLNRELSTCVFHLNVTGQQRKSTFSWNREKDSKRECAK